MQAFNDCIVAQYNGALVPVTNASCSVYLHGTSTLATIYSDNGTTPTANPTITSSTGRVTFYAADGRYDLSIVASGFSPVTVSDILLEDVTNPSAVVVSGGSVDNSPVGATTPSTGAFTTLSASSTVSGAGFSTYLASPPAIGGTAAAAGSFTTLSASSTVSGAGFSTYLASPPAIGGTAPAAGKFTTLESTGNATIGDAEATDTHAIKGATTLLANSASAALTVTQTGAGNAFVVEDSASTDSDPFVIDTNGRVAIGSTTALPAGAGLTAKLGIANGTLNVSRYINDASPSVVDLARSRNTTVGSQTIVQSGDGLGVVHFSGSDGVGLIRSASIIAEVDGTPGVNDMPGRLLLCTSPDGTATPTTKMTIFNDGATTLLANSSSAALTVTQTGTGNAFVVEDSASTDSTPFVVTGAGIAVAGHTASIPGAFSDQAIVQSVIAGGSASFAGYRFSADTGGAIQYFYKSRGATAGTNTIINSGDVLGSINFAGADGTTYHRAASIQGEVDGTPGTNDMPGRLVFSVTPDGGSSPVEAMRISNSGNVGIGGAPVATTALYNVKQITGGTTSYGFYNAGQVQSGTATSGGAYFQSSASTSAGTTTNIIHYGATQGAFTGTVTAQFGALVDSTLTGATNNYGFYSNIASAANRYNFYAAGTALNYFAGHVITAQSYTSWNATAIPAGGATGVGTLFSSTANFGVFFGSGAPTLSAAKGSLYLRSDGSTTNDRMYVNSNGSTTWVAVITAA